MPKNQTQSVPSVEEIMERLRLPQAAKSSDTVLDSVAVGAGRFAAAVVSAGPVARDAYHLETERQLRRRAERIHRAFA